jgi:hypothetical protein
MGGVAGSGGALTTWPNIRIVGNQMRDRWGKPFAVRSIESMFGNGTSDAVPLVAGHKALGANTVGPMPQPNASSADAVEALLDAAYQAGLVVGLNADHSAYTPTNLSKLAAPPVVAARATPSQSNPALRTSFQWWVYFNSGDSYSNNLTTSADDALSGITATGRDVKAKLEMDRTLIELGPLNP